MFLTICCLVILIIDLFDTVYPRLKLLFIVKLASAFRFYSVTLIHFFIYMKFKSKDAIRIVQTMNEIFDHSENIEDVFPMPKENLDVII